MPQQPQASKIPKIIIPENVNEFYSNAFFVATTAMDFGLLFGTLVLPTNVVAIPQSNPQEIRVDVVIRMSPQQAKLALASLKQAIDGYEEKIGKINTPKTEVINANTTNQ